MTLVRHLTHHLVIAAMQAALVVAAMWDRAAGVGVVIGLGVAAVVTAIRGYRRDRRRAAEAAELDAKLSAALDAVKRRGIVVIDVPTVPDEEPRYS
jgi:uncharacterized membrane protein